MFRLIRLTLVLVILLASLPAIPALAATRSQPTFPPPLDQCATGYQSSGAAYAICVPPSWNGDLVIFAHGYVAPDEPWDKFVEQLILPDGTSLPGLVTSLGYAFATTSYSVNGLAVIQGVADVTDLVSIFRIKYPQTRYVYLTGASEGGLVTTLAVERRPDVFSGGLATCGPVGDFRQQINYWGDFRVVFDYFFPNLLPTWTQSNARISPEVQANWEPVLTGQIIGALVARPQATQQLLRVTKAPVDPADSKTIAETVLGILWYNIFATNDGMDKLGGNPFDNNPRWYFGSNNDWLLNKWVQRFDADQAALNKIALNYQTTGRLTSPLVTLHTTGDPIVPYWHETLYRMKVLSAGSTARYSGIPILRYGHCSFEASEVLAGFALMVLKVTGRELVNAQMALPSADAQMKFKQLAVEHGALK